MSTLTARYKAEFFPVLVQKVNKYLNHHSQFIKFCLFTKEDGFVYLRVSMAFTTDDIMIPIFFIDELKPYFVINKAYLNKTYKKEAFRIKFDMMCRKFLINDFLNEI